MKPRPDALALLDPTRSTPRHRPGAVYLLPHCNRLRFKVGWRVHPMLRIQQLPEFHAKALDLVEAQVAWFAQAQRAHQVERALHRSLEPFSVDPGHGGDGRTEWFSAQGILLARRILSLLPCADGSAGRTTLQPLAQAADPPGPDEAIAAEASQGNALDTWYRVEDLWRRLGALLPLAVEVDRGRRCMHWLGLRALCDPGSIILRCRAVDLDTYRWSEAGQCRSLVTLMDWAQEDLLLHLTPAWQLQRWTDGDAVEQWLGNFLALHAAQARRPPAPRAGPTAWRSAPAPTG
jgi:hypothetical protein